MTEEKPIVAASDVVKLYPPRDRQGEPLRALDHVNLDVHGGEPVGVVGESGSGKTTLMRVLLGLERPTSGEVSFRGVELRRLGRQARTEFRNAVGVVLQNPYSSLDPRMSIWDTITEQMAIMGIRDRKRRRSRASELLEMVRLSKADLDRYPKQLSGGQRQRVAIARALALNPKLIVLDEAVSALDVSVRAQLINLLREIQRNLGLALLFVAHDLAIVNHLCDRTVVMHRGRIIEAGQTGEIFGKPQHRYTVDLIRASLLDPSELEASASTNGGSTDTDQTTATSSDHLRDAG